ncbi:hypothetical protein HDV03_001875 [Kappamyces sp. JEL0829]|nr:hypothetical protein HDV03_001875 [Kappamyces sp. JEL0829]
MLSPFSGTTPTSPKFSHEETVMFIKKNIQTVERNYSQLQSSLESYTKHQTRNSQHQINGVEVQTKAVKVATCLDIIAESETEESKYQLSKLSKLIQQQEAARAELVQRITSLCIDPLSAYPTLCDKLMSDMKSQKNAILLQKKKRQQADQVLLKESGEFGRTTSSKITKSQMELAEATGQVASTTDSLQEALYKFDELKGDDLKVVIHELVMSELSYHAR